MALSQKVQTFFFFNFQQYSTYKEAKLNSIFLFMY